MRALMVSWTMLLRWLSVRLVAVTGLVGVIRTSFVPKNARAAWVVAPVRQL